MPTINTQSSSKAPVFRPCPVCYGIGAEPQTFNKSGSLVESQLLDGVCFVCNGARVVSVDSICFCGRAASFRFLEGKLQGSLYCGRLECAKRLLGGETVRKSRIAGWLTDEEEDDYAARFPYCGT